MGNGSLMYAEVNPAAAAMMMVGSYQNPEQFSVSAGQRNILAYAVWLFEQDFW